MTADALDGLPSTTPVAFPRWLRLKGVGDFEHRHRVTSEVADSISASGGFLAQSNILSDMITVMTLEDVEPAKLQDFENRITDVHHFRLDPKSLELLQECQGMLLPLEEDTGAKIPTTVSCNLQVSWVGAPGDLRQVIPAVG
jgi:hypothetical protein